MRLCCVCCYAKRECAASGRGIRSVLNRGWRTVGKGKVVFPVGLVRTGRWEQSKKISKFNSFFVFMVCTIRVVFFGGAYFNVGKNSRSKYGRKYRWLVITDECKDVYMNVSTRRGKNLKSFNLSKNRFERNVRPRPSGADGAVAWARGRVAIFHSATNGKNKNSPLTDGQKYDTISLQKV